MEGWTLETQRAAFRDWAYLNSLDLDENLDTTGIAFHAFIQGWQEGHQRTLRQLGEGALLWDRLEGVAHAYEEDEGYREREKVARRVLNFVLGKGDTAKGAATKVPKP